MPGFMDSVQCCRFLVCSRSTLYRLRCLGLPRIKLPAGAGFRYEEDLVRGWIQEHRPRRARLILYGEEAERRASRVGGAV